MQHLRWTDNSEGWKKSQWQCFFSLTLWVKCFKFNWKQVNVETKLTCLQLGIVHRAGLLLVGRKHSGKVFILSKVDAVSSGWQDFQCMFNVSWENCIAIVTHGAAAMTRCKSGVVSQAKESDSIILAPHCMCTGRLWCRNHWAELHSVVSTGVTVVNYIRFKPLQSWLFGQPSREMGTGDPAVPLRGALAHPW